MGKQFKLLIGVPSYFSIDPHFHSSMLQAFAHLAANQALESVAHLLPPNTLNPDRMIIGCELVNNFGDSPNVGRARNAISRKFLAGDFTDLLFIDSDIIFKTEDIYRILSHDEDIVGGVYFKKQEGIACPVINSVPGAKVRDDFLVQVAYLGTGFLRIRRNVFERMIEKWGEEIWYNLDGQEKPVREYNFWNLGMKEYGPGNRRWLSEDWWFCQRCAELGIPVWADRKIPLKHSGNIVFPLTYQEKSIFGEPEQSEPLATALKDSPPAGAVV